MSTIALVPARCGSKSIPMKNIKSFCGKPLIYWVLNALEKATEVDEVFVATDCHEIKEIVEGFDFKKSKTYMRSTENAQDDSSTESVMLEFIETEQIDENNTFILAQATTPLTRSIDFSQALTEFHQERFDSLLTCTRMKFFIWSQDGESINYDFKKRPRRQEIAGELIENGAFYISKVSNIIKYKNRLSGKIGIHEMPHYTHIEIDEEDDWIVGEALMRKHLLNNPRVAEA